MSAVVTENTSLNAHTFLKLTSEENSHIVVCCVNVKSNDTNVAKYCEIKYLLSLNGL